MAMATKSQSLRKARVRKALKANNNGRPRLSVHRTGKNIYAQIIDDASGRTLAQASTIDKDVKASVKNGSTAEAAATVDCSRQTVELQRLPACIARDIV